MSTRPSFGLAIGSERTIASARPAKDEQLEQLYRRYSPMIYARCRRLLDDEASARDATQETFIRVQRHLARAPDERAALAWIYRIATNHCLNELKRRQRHAEPDGLDLAELLDRSQGEGALEGLLADRDLLRRLIVRTPEKLLTVAWLHHVDGLTQDEVARVQGITPRTVINRLEAFRSHARKFLARCT